MPCPLPRWTQPLRLSVTSRSVQPSLMSRQVGVHDFTFEACSGFTRVTACRLAQPPQVAFVTRLQPSPLRDQAACQLPDLPTAIWVALPPTGDPRCWGALDIPASVLHFLKSIKGSLKLNERCWNVYENKGRLWKTRIRNRNVIENKGTYLLNPGMLLKAHDLVLLMAER